MKNLKLFTQELLVETASLFPELRVLKYLPSKKAVQKEWQGVFDTPTRKLLKELWELVNNTGSYSDLFSKKLESNKNLHIKFTLDNFVFNFITSSRNIIEDKYKYQHEMGEYYTSGSKQNPLYETKYTEMNYQINIKDNKFIIFIDYEIRTFMQNDFTDRVTDDLYEDVWKQINSINILSNLLTKSVYYSLVDGGMDSDDEPYIRFFMDLDVTIPEYEDEDEEPLCWGMSKAVRYKNIIAKKIKIELENGGFQF